MQQEYGDGMEWETKQVGLRLYRSDGTMPPVVIPLKLKSTWILLVNNKSCIIL